MAPIWDLLYDHDADVVLTGHDHVYERFAPKGKTGRVNRARGIREFVVGTGGRSHYPFVNIRKGSKFRNNTRYGILKLWLGSGGYRWRFKTATGRIIDTGDGRCH